MSADIEDAPIVIEPEDDEPEVDEPVEDEPTESVDPKNSAFRQMLAADIVNVFLDLEYFGELHQVEHRMIKVVIDEDVNRQAAKANELGTTMTGFVMFCRESDLDRQLEGTQLEMDGRIYTVEDWRTDEGMHRITLSMRTAY